MRGSKLQEECRSRIAGKLASIDDSRNAGTVTAGFLCSGFPSAVAAGLGLRPLRITQGRTPASVDAVTSGVRPDVCPFVLSVLDSSDSRTGMAALVDQWIGLATCDHTRRCFALMAGDRTVHHIQFPSTRTDEASRYYQWQVTDLVERLERTLGVEYSAELAFEYARGMHGAGEYLTGIACSCSMSPLDLHMLLQLALISEPGGLREELEDLAGLAEDYSPWIRIALTGSALSLEDTHLLEVLQDIGAAAVPLGCTGLQSLPFLGLNCLPASGSPSDLAAEAFRSSRCARCRPNEATFEYIREGIRLTGCSGLLVKTLKFCDLWFTERERLRERMEVPVLVMDTSYGQGEALRQTNRLEAFLETLRR